jgi:hypothetical protein
MTQFTPPPPPPRPHLTIAVQEQQVLAAQWHPPRHPACRRLARCRQVSLHQAVVLRQHQPHSAPVGAGRVGRHLRSATGMSQSAAC